MSGKMLLSAAQQEGVALAIVAGVGLGIAFRFYRKWIAPPLAEWLLQRGKVKWAMKVRSSFYKPAQRRASPSDNDCKCS